MSEFRFGDVVLVDFPFTSGAQAKRRPALVINQDTDDDILLARITSKPKESDLDAKITDWKKSKLLLPSAAMLGKLTTLSIELVETKIGELTERDQSEVIAALERLLLLLVKKK